MIVSNGWQLQGSPTSEGGRGMRRKRVSCRPPSGCYRGGSGAEADQEAANWLQKCHDGPRYKLPQLDSTQEAWASKAFVREAWCCDIATQNCTFHHRRVGRKSIDYCSWKGKE